MKLINQIRIEHLWGITVLVGIFAFLNTHPIRPHDYWWHLAVGRDIIESGSIPEVDIYSFTRLGEPYPSYNMFWLSEVVLYFLYRTGGPILTLLANSVVISTAYWIIFYISLRSSNNWRAAAFGTLFAAALGFGNWNIRPQSISYLFGALLLLGIVEFKRTKKWRWLLLLPVVMVVWVNSHGSFPIGVAIIGCWVADECWMFLVNRINREPALFRSLLPSLVALGLSLAALPINPKGFWIIGYLKTMASNTAVQNYILEWMPPTLSSLEGGIFFISLFATAILMAVSPKRPVFSQLLVFSLFGLLGIKYIRGIIWFGLVLAPVVAFHISEVLKPWKLSSQADNITPAQTKINRIFVFAILLLAVFSLPWFKKLFPFTQAKSGIISIETPIQATNNMLENDLPREVFHDMAFGSYLIWAAQPEYPVFVDSRIELYSMEIWDDYFIISNALCGWEAKLDYYGIKTLLLEPEKEAQLIDAVKKSQSWELVYQDAQAVVFTR